MIKILVADKLSQLGIDWMEEQPDVEVANKPGMDPEELAKIIGEYDGMIIRSGVKAKWRRYGQHRPTQGHRPCGRGRGQHRRSRLRQARALS